MIELRLFKSIKIMTLKTQQIRESLIMDLSDILREARAEMEQCQDPQIRGEWMRLISYLAQTINTILKTYDDTRFNEDMQKLEELIEKAKRLRGKESETESP